MTARTLRAARVRVPCSTSNLGAGFDCIGLALDRYLDVSFEPATHELRVERAGTLATLAVAAGDDAVATALRAHLATRGAAAVGGVLRMTSEIPVARGLGSSAAATVAGLLLAAAAIGDDTPDRRPLLAQATRIEGHADNAAPALLGGLVGIARTESGEPRPFPLSLSPRLAFAFAAPPVEVSTAYARRVLPATVSHDTAVRALARVAALLHGLATGNAELLHTGFTDELHVPWRLPLIPGAPHAMRAALDAGAFAVTVSGSGSGLIAVCDPAGATRVADAMARGFAAAAVATGVIAFPLHPDTVGAEVFS
jgi:homoserine kinase